MFERRFLSKTYIDKIRDNRLSAALEKTTISKPVEQKSKVGSGIDKITPKKEDDDKLPAWRLVESYLKQNKKK